MNRDELLAAIPQYDGLIVRSGVKVRIYIFSVVHG